jgi:hypothetical protein
VWPFRKRKSWIVYSVPTHSIVLHNLSGTRAVRVFGSREIVKCYSLSAWDRFLYGVPLSSARTLRIWKRQIVLQNGHEAFAGDVRKGSEW